jgi:hypothetical protein
MPKFAVINDTVVVNTVVADSKGIAEQVTGLICVEFTDEPAETGGTYVDGMFIQKKPYPSWISKNGYSWQVPVPYPEFDSENPKYYTWDESVINWVEINP